MTDDNKHDDKDREKVSDEEMEEVAGGTVDGRAMRGGFVGRDTKKRGDSEQIAIVDDNYRG